MRDTVDKYKFLVRKIIRQKTGMENSDLEQEVFFRIWQKQHLYSNQGKEVSWICVITNNICIDYFKSKFFNQSKQHVEIPDNLSDNRPTPDVVYSDKQRQRIILRAVNSLPHKLRTTIILYEFEGLSIEEIASKLRIPSGTIKSRLHTARKILAQKLSGLQPK
ncbi:MAG: sigma-70 family RNA polymerase sigma factor [Alphaproteobacteria bacterium]|nr:sigma-70 family RNA polymerase sigma factor [Alphaproteobacteria bacterium]